MTRRRAGVTEDGASLLSSRAAAAVTPGAGASAAPGIDARPDVADDALQALRGDTLYLNVAGSGPTFPVAADAAERFRRWLSEVGMFSHLGYNAYNDALARARADIAAMLGDPGGAARVALAQSATDALNTVVGGLRLQPGSTIVTTAEEHASALLPVYARRVRGDRVVVVAYDSDEAIVEDVRRALAVRGGALVVSLVSCKTGKRLPVEALCSVAREAGAYAIVDAAQALGQVAVDVQRMGAHAVVVLGHKWLHGPLATGAMWLRELDRVEPTRLGWRSRVTHDLDGGIDLQPDATRFETGTVDAGAFVGMSQAIAVHAALGSRVARRISELRERLFAFLRELPFDVLSRPEDPTGIVTIVPRAGDVAAIVTRMWTDEDIVVKHLADPGTPEAIRISFWALHREPDLVRLRDGLARQAAARA